MGQRDGPVQKTEEEHDLTAAMGGSATAAQGPTGAGDLAFATGGVTKDTGAGGHGAGDQAATQPPDASPAALERGRLLFAGRWVFLRSCMEMSHLPPAGPTEVAFAGRSNVGKSTLFNALVGQKGLAKASNTPGRTRALNLFAREEHDEPLLVDMPGYGYAKAPKVEVAAWTKLVFNYLRGRPQLRRIYLLIDARHGLKPVDEEAMQVMDEAAVSYQAVLTKADKSVPPHVVAQTTERLRRRPAAHPQVLLTSAATGDGIAQLRAAIAELLP